MEEIWKTVHDIKELNINVNKYGHIYEVSNMGRVRNASNNKIFKERLNKAGYDRVCLNSKEYLVHRLVAYAFIENENPESFNIINHKDLNRKNNCVDNLEWCDHAYNVKYSIDKGSYVGKAEGENNGRSLLTNEQVIDVWINNRSTDFITEKYGMTKKSAIKLKEKQRFKHLIPLYESMFTNEEMDDIKKTKEKESRKNKSLGRSNFSEQQILDIIKLMNDGMNNVEISKIYNVVNSTISTIRLQTNLHAQIVVNKYNLTIKQNPRNKHK